MDRVGELPDRFLTDEQRMMRETCRRYVDRVVKPFIAANREREWFVDPAERTPPEMLEEADAAGLRTLGVPAEYGGVDLDPATEAQTFAIIATELSRGDTGLTIKLAQGWKISIILRELAPKHLQDEWFPRFMADPQLLMAHCLTEQRGASDRWLPYNAPEAAMETKAVHEDGHWRINGRKQFISNGYDATLYVVYANTDPSVGMLDGTSSFLVPRDTPGLEVTRCNETLGGRYENNGEITLTDCRIPDDHLLAEGRALTMARNYFRPGKITVAAGALGVGMAAFEDTARFVQERVVGGRLLIKHQAVAGRIADMATKLEAVSALLRRAAVAVDNDDPDTNTLCFMVKVFSANAIVDVCHQAVELHGGYGAMMEVGIEKYYRDALLYLHTDSTTDIANFKIVKDLFPQTAGAYAGPE